MTEITALPLFVEQQERNRLRIRLQNLAEMLIAKLSIDPFGKQLVIACGTGLERNNREAILEWLNKAICCEARLDVLESELICQALERHLQHCIGHWCN